MIFSITNVTCILCKKLENTFLFLTPYFGGYQDLRRLLEDFNYNMHMPKSISVGWQIATINSSGRSVKKKKLCDSRLGVR